MKHSKTNLAVGALMLATLLMATAPVHATSAEAWMKLNYALAMMDRVNTLQNTLGTNAGGAPVAVVAPQPIAGNSGRFMAPYASDGTVTAWAGKAMQARTGAAVGSEFGGRAAGALATKVPVVGGLFSGFMKKKATESAAVMAMGGWNQIRDSSNQSFDNLDDLAVYMHVNHSGRSDYQEALAATMALYPDLEGRYEPANQAALQRARLASPAQLTVVE
jgi:hypothetical protein